MKKKDEKGIVRLKIELCPEHLKVFETQREEQMDWGSMLFTVITPEALYCRKCVHRVKYRNIIGTDALTIDGSEYFEKPKV